MTLRSKGLVEGSYRDGCGITIYAPPSTINLPAAPAPEETQTLFPFFTELSPRKRHRDATTLIPQLQPSRETK